MNAKQKTEACIEWIKDYFKDNPDGKAIIGISGGKDSTIAAALCVEALGADRVVGVMMPNRHQDDLDDAKEVCELLEIIPLTINIGLTCTTLMDWIAGSFTFEPHEKKYINSVNEVINNPMIKTNLPARIRMTTLYAVAALYPNSRVVNTCNRSEDYVGYSTKYGDAAGDFSPLGNLTVREVLEIGDELGLPEHLVHKAPSDGMCGKTDEDNLGFTYKELDNFILGTGPVSDTTADKILKMHKATRHKYQPIPTFRPTYSFTEEDYSKTQRGERAKCGIMDDYAGGNVINPKGFPPMPNEYTMPSTPKPYNPIDACQPQFDKVMEALDKLNEALDRKIGEQQ